MVFYLVQILCCKWSKTASPWDGNWLCWTPCAADFQPHQITPLSSMCIPKCPLFMLNCALKKERKEIRCCHGMNYGVAFSSSCNKFVFNTEMGIMRIRAPPRLMPPFKVENLEWVQTSWLALISHKGKPLRSHVVGWKYPVHLDNPTMNRWTIGCRCTRNQVLGRSIIPVPFQPYPT